MKIITKRNRHTLERMTLLILCFCFFSSASIASNANEMLDYLVVWEKDGSSVSFPLEEHPCLTFDTKASKVHCVTTRQSIDFSLEAVHKYTIVEKAATKIEELSAETGVFSRNNSSLLFEKFPVHAQVRIYQASGKLFQTYTVNESGRLQIPIHHWPGGLYLIKTSNVTYKILKK